MSNIRFNYKCTKTGIRTTVHVNHYLFSLFNVVTGYSHMKTVNYLIKALNSPKYEMSISRTEWCNLHIHYLILSVVSPLLEDSCFSDEILD